LKKITKKIDYPEDLYGTFYTEEIFIVLVTWVETDSSTENYTIFYWQGRDAPQKQQDASLLSIPVDDSMDGKASQIVVYQHKEPPFFSDIFNNKIIIKPGNHTNISKLPELYELRGTDYSNIQAVQIECNPRALNSMHCFILCTENKCYIWEGSLCNECEKKSSKGLCCPT
jgi:hypothetical protein